MIGANRVLVVGGGITGLTAAWEAALSGASVTLVEAGPVLGGKLRTEHVDGLLVEHGPDSFVAYRPAALQLIGELGLTDQVIEAEPRREVSLRVDGKLQPIPAGMGMVLPTRLGPFATTPILSWRHKARAGQMGAQPRTALGQRLGVRIHGAHGGQRGRVAQQTVRNARKQLGLNMYLILQKQIKAHAHRSLKGIFERHNAQLALAGGHFLKYLGNVAARPELGGVPKIFHARKV